MKGSETVPDAKKFTFTGGERSRRLITAVVFFAALLLVSCVMLLSRVNNWGGGEKGYIHRIINSESPVSADWSPEFEMIDDGQLVCADCAAQLRSMLSDCRAQGLAPRVYSSYRSPGAQENVVNSLAEKLMTSGNITAEEAYAKAVAQAGAPGCSEHQLGYAVDIIDGAHTEPDLNRGTSEVLDWLRDNSWRYGFILRYTEAGRNITGVEYMPWHFRYVGGDAAEQIHNLGITLEEYNKLFFSEASK